MSLPSHPNQPRRPGRLPMLAAPLPAVGSDPDPVLGAFHALVDRLEAVIGTETEALSRHLPIDIGASNRQKRQGMLELSRLMRSLPGVAPQDEARARLAGLAAALERNQKVLDIQLRAVGEVAEIVAKVMRDAESDGTYTLRTGWQ